MTEEFERLYQVVFLSCAVTLVLLERVHALQRNPVQIARRWTSNIGLLLIGSGITAVVLPIGVYAFAQQQPPGLMSRLGLSFAAQVLLTFLLLDLWRYWEHRLFHRLPLLWRVHLVHHSDTQIDVTTSERHHPVEILLGTAVLVGLIVALGLPAPALGLYLLTATVVALYSHANIRLPGFLERPLSRFIVTPPVHAVHHSDLQPQTDSNYGSVLTIWDRLFGTYVDPVNAKIPHFGLHYFHRPDDTRLTRVLQQPFLFRRDLDYPKRDSGPVDPGAVPRTAVRTSRCVLTQESKSTLLGGIVGCLLVTLAMWPTVLELTAVWRNSEAYQYAWLVLPMVGYLLGWHPRLPGLPVDPQPDLTGVFVVVVAAACWSAAALMNIDVGRQFALVLSLQGVAMATLGWRSYLQLFPTLALMFLMVPAGDLLQPALRVLTLESIEVFALAANLPHSVDGFVIFIGIHRYIVVDECSGLPYVTLAAFLGYCFGLLLGRPLWQTVAMSLFGALLGILSNVLRVNAIVLIDWMRGTQMPLTAHGAVQWIVLLATLGALLYGLSRLRVNAAPEASPVAAPSKVRPIGKVAPLVAGLSAFLIVSGAAGLQANDPRPPRGMQSGLFPQYLSGWSLADTAAVWSVDQQGLTESIRLTYHRGGRELQVVIVETLSHAAKLPESGLAPDDGKIWREKRVRNESGCVGSSCVPLLHSIWQRDKSQQVRHVYFAYSIGDVVTDSRFAIRAAHGWSRLTGGHANPRLTGFVSEDATIDVDELAAAFKAVQAAMKKSR